MSNQTILVVFSTMNPMIDQMIAPIVLVPQTFLTPATNEFVVDTALGGAWVNRSPRKVSRMGVDRSTPGNIHDTVSVKIIPTQY